LGAAGSGWVVDLESGQEVGVCWFTHSPKTLLETTKHVPEYSTLQRK